LLSGFVFVTYVGASEGWPSIQKFIGTSLAIGGLVTEVTLIVCPTLFVFVGLPLYALSIRRNWVSLKAYTIAGFTASVIATILFAPALPWRLMALFLIGGGTAATAAFWLVVRPDRSQAHG
jgi:hypothetical protein